MVLSQFSSGLVPVSAAIVSADPLLAAAVTTLVAVPVRRCSRALRRVVVGALLLLVVGPLVGRAAAHATLTSSVPRADETTATVPTQVELSFDESVTVDRGSIEVYDPKGRRVDTGAATASESGTRQVVKVRDAGKGTYTVSYSVLSADGHVVSGSFVYNAVQRSESGGATLNDGSRVLGSTLATLGRWLALLGSFVAGGVLWTALFVTGRDAERHWAGGLVAARRLLVPAAAATLFGCALALLGRAVELSGQGVFSAVGEVPGIVTGSRTGTIAGLRVVVALVVMVAVAGGALLKKAPWLAALGILATLILPSFAGHASTSSFAVLAVSADLVHVLAASVWVGGLAVVVLTWADDGPPSVGDRARGYSRMALIAAPLTVLTGVARGWWITQSWQALTQTQGGRLLMLKAVGVLVMLGFGWVHRRWLADRARDVAGVVVGLRTELLIGVAVLAVTAVLVDTRPPVEAVVRPFEGGGRAGEVVVRIEVTPDSAGPNDVHIFFTDEDNAPVPVDAYELKVSSSKVEPRRVPVTTITASHGTATGVELTRGTWDFHFTIVNKGQPATTDIEVPIR